MLPGFQKGLLLGQGNLKDELTTKINIRCTLWVFFFFEGIFLECHAFGSYKVLILLPLVNGQIKPLQNIHGACC